MEWIDVNKELPEPHKDVLVLSKGGGITVRYYVPADGVHFWGWYPGGLPICNSSHWMPLPDPPKQD